MCNQLAINDYTRMLSYSFLTKVSNQPNFKRFTNRQLAAAAIYLISRHQGCPRPVSEIMKAASVSKSRFTICFRYLKPFIKGIIAVTRPGDLIDRFAALLSITEEQRSDAKQIISNIDNKSLLENRAPSTIAATAIYVACKNGRTMTEIAKTLNVSYHAIRFAYNTMYSLISPQ